MKGDKLILARCCLSGSPKCEYRIEVPCEGDVYDTSEWLAKAAKGRYAIALCHRHLSLNAVFPPPSDFPDCRYGRKEIYFEQTKKQKKEVS